MCQFDWFHIGLPDDCSCQVFFLVGAVLLIKIPNAVESRKLVSSKILIPELALKVGGLSVVFIFISPIILIIGLKIHVHPCQVIAVSLFLVITRNVSHCIALLHFMLSM